MEVQPDSVQLDDDGTATIAWPLAPVDPDAPRGDTFLPAWFIPRPRMGVMRNLMERYNRTARAQGEAARRAAQMESVQARLAAGEEIPAEEQTEFADAAEALVATIDDVMWDWWSGVMDQLAQPIGEPWPRPVTEDDAPPWLLRNTAIYIDLVNHWMRVPLARGSGAIPTTAGNGGRASVRG